MSAENEGIQKREPARASKLALAAAAQIADWCESRKLESIEEANRQVRTIWVLLGGGVILLLLLPRLVALVDYTAATLPPDAVRESNSTLELMEVNKIEIEKQFENSRAALSTREGELKLSNNTLSSASKTFTDPFENSLSVWERIAPVDFSFEINAFLQTKNGGLLAAGYEQTDKGQMTLLLHSPNGETWATVRPMRDKSRISGTLNSLLQTTDGDLIAAGAEQTSEGVKTLLLRSPDGESWSTTKLGREKDQISGALTSLSQTPTGGMVAVGGETTNEGQKVLLLHSLTGRLWFKAQVEAPGESISGILHDTVALPDGSLIAAGREVTQEGDAVLFLRSANGETWSAIRPEEGSVPIWGAIASLSLVSRGELVAAGREDAVDGQKTLILHSAKGKSWSVRKPMENGSRIKGIVNDVILTSAGTLIGAGGETTPDGRRAIFLSSSDGISWSVHRPEFDGDQARRHYWKLHQSADGKIYADGLSAPFIRTSLEAKDEVKVALTNGKSLPNFAVPKGSKDRAEFIRESQRKSDNAREQFLEQKKLFEQAKALHLRQTDAVEQIAEANTILLNALRHTEPVRQASWIATRLAIVALLIFLVQIVVNRYRYLQRLADFYDGRAQAFRMLATSGPTAAGAILHDVSLNELMAGLSPSSISFGREAEPPTQHLMSVLQSAIKK